VKYFLGVIKIKKETIIQKPIINSPNLKPKMYKPAKGLADSINMASIPIYKIEDNG
tara:strand:+ start:65 stop:232 length:168 start_codon:yes stop_codon:yes gene_type:complete